MKANGEVLVVVGGFQRGVVAWVEGEGTLDRDLVDSMCGSVSIVCAPRQGHESIEATGMTSRLAIWESKPGADVCGSAVACEPTEKTIDGLERGKGG